MVELRPKPIIIGKDAKRFLDNEKKVNEELKIMGMRIKIDETIPKDEIHLKNDNGCIIGKIINIDI